MALYYLESGWGLPYKKKDKMVCFKCKVITLQGIKVKNDSGGTMQVLHRRWNSGPIFLLCIMTVCLTNTHVLCELP